MKRFSKKFYFVVVFLIILTLIFFIMYYLKSKKADSEKKLVVEEGTKSAVLLEQEIEKEKTLTIPAAKPADVQVLSEQDKKFLATLEKEDLPKDIANIQFAHLDVPFFKQEYIRSCEEASLRMILAFYGIETNDMEIVQKVGYDPHPWDIKNNIWDDPDKMFVGSIDDPNKNGYGAFAPAISSAAKKFGRNSESYVGITAQFLAQQIYNEHPVIVWGFYSVPPFVKYSWNTKDGKKIIAYRGEHARVVTGVFGDPLKPVGFLISDPLTGEKNQYWSSERLMNHMNAFGNLTNQAVVVN